MSRVAVTSVPLLVGVLGALFIGEPISKQKSSILTNSEEAVIFDFENADPEIQELVEEHCLGGLPSDENILVRPGYVASYNTNWRIPIWVGYHITPDYLKTPKREGKFESFRTDWDTPNPVKDKEYTNSGYARGHMAPYGVMGGDRNDNGQYARDEDEREYPTVFSANFMSNITPQWHDGFNGNSGLWYNLERWIQSQIVKKSNTEVWIYAGAIVTTETPSVISKESIVVPDMFYKIVAYKENEEIHALAFLFPHRKLKKQDLTSYLVSIDYIETLANVDFFHNLGEASKIDESTNTKQVYLDKFMPNFPSRYLQ